LPSRSWLPAYDEAMTAATIIAIVAAVVALLALAACVLVLRKVQRHEQLLEREIERGKSTFDEVVASEVEERSAELERTLARLRADSLSQLAEEERRIAEERRRDVAERERDASARLSEQLDQFLLALLSQLQRDVRISQVPPADDDPQPRASIPENGSGGRHRQDGDCAHAAALVRDAPVRSRCRYQDDSSASGARQVGDDGTLHTCGNRSDHRRRQPA